jgi:predicted RNase H-like HicB family nuclease
MTRYVALIDGERGAYGIAFPDCPGCTAMGATLDEALDNAATALAEWISDEANAGRKAPVPRLAEKLRKDVAVALSKGALLCVVPVIEKSSEGPAVRLRKRRRAQNDE